MKRFVQCIELVVKLLPSIVAAVQAIETAVPVAGQGASKAELLRTLVIAAYGAAGEDLPPEATVLAAVDRVTAGVVSMLKQTGKFPAAV